jgi:hypothetical protein
MFVRGTSLAPRGGQAGIITGVITGVIASVLAAPAGW